MMRGKVLGKRYDKEMLMPPLIESIARCSLAESAFTVAQNAEYPKHTHDEYVISANLTGKERIFFDGHHADVSSQQVTIYNPMTVQSSVFQDNKTSFISIHINASVIRNAFENSHDTSAPVIFAEGVFTDANLLDCIVKTHQAASSKYREESIYSLLSQLSSYQAKTLSNDDPPVIRKLVEYMYDSLYDDISLNDMSLVASVSKFHLVRMFKSIFCLPPMQYLKQLRLIEARRRLRLGHAAAQVAVELFFYDQGHMSNAFRKVMGIPPGRYVSMISHHRW